VKFTEEQWQKISEAIGEGSDALRSELEMEAFLLGRHRTRGKTPRQLAQMADRTAASAKIILRQLKSSSFFCGAIARGMAVSGGGVPTKFSATSLPGMIEQLIIAAEDNGQFWRSQPVRRGSPGLRPQQAAVEAAERLWVKAGKKVGRSRRDDGSFSGPFIRFAKAWIDAARGVDFITEDQIGSMIGRRRKKKGARSAMHRISE